MVGRFCRVEPLDVERHADELHLANRLDVDGRNWTYVADGPFADLASYRNWLTRVSDRENVLFHAIIDARAEKAVGLAAYLNITPTHGVIEVGSINYSPLLQRTIAGTEAMDLMMQRVFDELGYRRYEWKCDALNAASRAAAQRYGFQFEGIFRQHVVVKGRNRDTAWYSITDGEWPAIRAAFARWLDPANFDEAGRQRRRLSELMPRPGTA
jgi:RimJ/RimL family protein N-acetyltransferase